MPQGITTEAADAYIASHGYNEIAEHAQSLAEKILRRTISPIGVMLLAAALLSYAQAQLFDCVFILALLVLNVAVAIYQEGKADTAIKELNEHLTMQVKVLRDGKWKRIFSRLLVPRDVIELRAGDVVPADARAARVVSASVNEAALTGESLPKEKHAGDDLYSGSFLASGIITAEVTATGGDTYFGRTLAAVDTSEKRSSLEKEILRISLFLSSFALFAVASLSIFLWTRHAPLLEILRLDLSLIVAGIPVSLPTVMTLIIAFGVVALARKGAIVRRLSSLEELANTDYLLTDKTGTLTKNAIAVERVMPYGGAQAAEATRLAALVAAQEPDAAINQAVMACAREEVHGEVRTFVPGDSDRKRSTAVVVQGGKAMTLSLGAPQIVADLCAFAPEERARFDADVQHLADGGYRALALARAEGSEERGMQLIGLFSLSDTLRADAGDVLRFLGENGVGVSMVTGDNRAIAREIARKLDIPGTRIETPQDRPPEGWGALAKERFDDAQAFAEILPADKYELVRSAKRFYTVAANGDGVNDLPAVRDASVGFAVRDAVDALKGAADIVLTTDGIAVMRDAFLEGRRIFMRLYAYSVYRISESFRLIVTIAVLGFLSGTYPLSPLQLILIALLNDIPIISLAGNRVRIANKPSKLNVGEQFSMSVIFGLVGVANSLFLYIIALHYMHLPMPLVQTMFFLKLTISGHLLIYLAHTRARWWRYLPSFSVIAATSVTQAVATLLAVSGFLMPAAIPWRYALFVWVWAIAFMQIGEFMKWLRDFMAGGDATPQRPAGVVS